MTWFIENKIFIFLEYINLLFILTLVKISYKIEKFNYIYITFLFIAGVLVYCFLHSILIKKSSKVLFFMGLIFIISIFSYFNSSYIIKLINEQIVSNFIYINSLVATGISTPFICYKPLIIVALPLIICIITFLCSKGFYNSILILSFAVITTLWYLGYTEEIKKYLFYYISITLITFSINGFKNNVKKLSKKGVKVTIDSRKILLYTVIAGIFIAGITDYMPQEYKGKYGSDFKSKFINKYVQNGESDEEKGKKFKYDLSFSGYDRNTKKLGGPITLNKLVAFRVKSDKPYYLKGAVKNTYDGFSWLQSSVNYNLQNEKDKTMFQDNFSKTFMDTSNTLSIYPEELNSTTLFSPIYSYNAQVDKGSVFYDNIPTFVTGDIIHKPYNIDFYNLNTEGLNIYNNGISKDNKEVGILYYAEYYKEYLQVPDNISFRVYDLVYSLTKDKKYNYEKVQAIKKYLNSNYTYTLKVSNVPEGQEFLDYFLFTEKKGYCTYFATAETVMCRIAGIPARYVEGFNMTEDKDKNGLYQVKNENAHAWTEVLYMQTPFIGLWYTVDAVPNAVDSIHKEEETSKVTQSTSGSGTAGGLTLPSKNQKDDTVEGNINTNKSLSPTLVKAIYLISLVLLINIIMIFKFIIIKHKIINNESIIPLYNYSLERLETIGVIKETTSSDLEFINTLPEELKDEVYLVAKLSYGEYFGGKKTENYNKKQYYKFIEDYINKRQSNLIYCTKKYYTFRKISLIKAEVMVLYRRIRKL